MPADVSVEPQEGEKGVAVQRFVHNPDEVVEDTVKGFVKVHSDLVRLAENPRVIVSKTAPVASKIGDTSGSGSGQEPVQQLDV